MLQRAANSDLIVSGMDEARRPIILHVDDDAASLMMAEGALEDAGFEVVQASDGMQAIDCFLAHDPDLIIMDAIMPKMDGFAAIAEIRGKSNGAHIPILMITGLDDLDSITRAYDEGATDFLTKPVNFYILPHRVQYMLRSMATADALRSSQAKLDNAQRIARLGNWEWNIENDELSWSREFGRILGVSKNNNLGSWTNFLEHIEDSEKQNVQLLADRAVSDSSAFNVEFRIASSGEKAMRTIRLEAEPHLSEAGDCIRMLGTMQDITEQIEAQAQIHNLAYSDLVTGLPNRAQLNDSLRFVLQTAERNESQFSLLFLDLDRFKKVNDTLGHDAGDELLRQVAERLTSALRESDSIVRGSDDEEYSSHTVARLGGDEFVVLLGHINRADDAARVAQRIGKSVSEIYTIDNTEVSVTTTIGIALYPADGLDADTLMKHADVAMYHAKEQGRNNYQFYSRGIHEKTLARFSMERELKHAVENNELTLVYQPKISMSDGSVAGVEALVRWHHPDNGLISPADFIPLAEDSGLILPLGQWVLNEACEQMQSWIDAGIGPFPVAVNFSAEQFTGSDIVQDIISALGKYGLDPRWLEVELTESLLLQDIEAGIEVLGRMRELGIQLSIDDFGTGFSSLSYLKRLPIDKLKIDQSFIRDLCSDVGDAAIVSAVIRLSHDLGLSVVAEGVETQLQYDKLLGYNCNEVQGFLVSYPLPPESFVAWLEEWQKPGLNQAAAR
ncbi:MAG: EAL domain-containing protein [Granulosicoccus sp.]